MRYARLACILAVTVLLRAESDGAVIDQPAQVRDVAGTVTITDTTPGAVMRYTLDGTDPDANAGPYLAPIELPAGGFVRARAFAPQGNQHSQVSTRIWAPLPGVQSIPSSLVPTTQDRSAPSWNWADRHRAACAAMKERNPQVIFIGDSITHLMGGEPADNINVGSPAWKREYEKYNAVNLGFGSDRTENVLWRLTHGELDNASPKVAVVLIGTNNLGLNTVDEIVSGITAVCETVHHKLPNTRILLLGMLPREPKPDARREQIAQINAQLSNLNGKDNITLLDIGSTFLNADGTISKTIMGDYVHPTVEGYDRWVKAVNPTLEKLLAN